MTYKEAINILKNNAINATGTLGALPDKARERSCLNQHLEALNMAIEALEKQIKKKPIKKMGAECGMYHKNENYDCCPTCGKPVEVDDDELWSTITFPTCECGQRIKYEWESDGE